MQVLRITEYTRHRSGGSRLSSTLPFEIYLSGRLFQMRWQDEKQQAVLLFILLV